MIEKLVVLGVQGPTAAEISNILAQKPFAQIHPRTKFNYGLFNLDFSQSYEYVTLLLNVCWQIKWTVKNSNGNSARDNENIIVDEWSGEMECLCFNLKLFFALLFK